MSQNHGDLFQVHSYVKGIGVRVFSKSFRDFEVFLGLFIFDKGFWAPGGIPLDLERNGDAS